MPIPSVEECVDMVQTILVEIGKFSEGMEKAERCNFVRPREGSSNVVQAGDGVGRIAEWDIKEVAANIRSAKSLIKLVSTRWDARDDKCTDNPKVY